MKALRVCVVDVPNINSVLYSMHGHQPDDSERLDYEALMKWLRNRLDEDEDLIACLFANVWDNNPNVRGWLEHVRQRFGFWTYPKPKTGESDIDEEMITFLEACRELAPQLKEVVVLSHDRCRFESYLEALAGEGVKVTVLGFPEASPRMSSNPSLSFIDLQSIKEVLPKPPPRTVSARPMPRDIPESGVLLPPSGARSYYFFSLRRALRLNTDTEEVQEEAAAATLEEPKSEKSRSWLRRKVSI